MKHGYLLVFLVAFFIPVITAAETDNNQRLWYEYPAEQWNAQALHIGNGYMGASFYGGVGEERFDITEKTMWTGGPGENPDYNYGIKPGGRDHIDEIRTAVIQGDIAKADNLTQRHMTGDYSNFGAFSMIGNLYFTFDGHDGACTGYLRELDLTESLGRVSYKMDGRRYTREYFCSYPGRVMAMRLTCGSPGGLNFTIRHELAQERSAVTVREKTLLIEGVINGNNRAYCARLSVLNEGGEVTAEGQALAVRDADAVTVLYTAATGYLPEPPR
jgi:alpha-L-fucosidase 2